MLIIPCFISRSPKKQTFLWQRLSAAQNIQLKYVELALFFHTPTSSIHSPGGWVFNSCTTRYTIRLQQNASLHYKIFHTPCLQYCKQLMEQATHATQLKALDPGTNRTEGYSPYNNWRQLLLRHDKRQPQLVIHIFLNILVCRISCRQEWGMTLQVQPSTFNFNIWFFTWV